MVRVESESEAFFDRVQFGVGQTGTEFDSCIVQQRHRVVPGLSHSTSIAELGTEREQPPLPHACHSSLALEGQSVRICRVADSSGPMGEMGCSQEMYPQESEDS